MTTTLWNHDWIIDWYSKLEDPFLPAICTEILRGAKKDSCSNCKYVYFDLRNSVTGDFYSKITNAFPNYFPKHRAEWIQIAHLINTHAQKIKNCRVVDVGCGSGSFLHLLDSGESKIGVDFEDYRKNTNDFVFQQSDLNTKFKLPPAEFYTAFHTLEHVENPIDFLTSFFSSAPSGAQIFLSVPNSENYRNDFILDPLNHPPHHLSNFTYDSLMSLFSQFDVEYEVTTIEKISIPRIIARLHAQSGGRMQFSEAVSAIFSAFQRPKFAFESFLVSAKKR